MLSSAQPTSSQIKSSMTNITPYCDQSTKFCKAEHQIETLRIHQWAAILTNTERNIHRDPQLGEELERAHPTLSQKRASKIHSTPTCEHSTQHCNPHQQTVTLHTPHLHSKEKGASRKIHWDSPLEKMVSSAHPTLRQKFCLCDSQHTFLWPLHPTL